MDSIYLFFPRRKKVKEIQDEEGIKGTPTFFMLLILNFPPFTFFYPLSLPLPFLSFSSCFSSTFSVDFHLSPPFFTSSAFHLHGEPSISSQQPFTHRSLWRQSSISITRPAFIHFSVRYPSTHSRNDNVGIKCDTETNWLKAIDLSESIAMTSSILFHFCGFKYLLLSSSLCATHSLFMPHSSCLRIFSLCKNIRSISSQTCHSNS